MAVRPADLYPNQVDTGDGNYPHGKAKNVVVANDGSGTPFEKEWLNDMWGFHQALLVAGGETPSGSPDHVNASQYLDAMRTVAKGIQPKARYRPFGSGYSSEETVSLTPVLGESGFNLVSDAVQVPSAGAYLVSLIARISSTTITFPVDIALGVYRGTTPEFHAVATRWDATTNRFVGVSASALVRVTTPASEAISVRVASAQFGDVAFRTTTSQDNALTIIRVGS